jgi:phosphoglycerate dehydrogenase-like enzyme
MDKIRVHIEPNSGSNRFFKIDKAALEQDRFATDPILERIDISFGGVNDQGAEGLSNAEILLCGRFDASNLPERAPKLKWIQSIFAGVESLIPQVAENVILTNTSGIHANKAGEYAMGAILSINGSVPQFIQAQHRLEWLPIYTSSVADKTVLILGTGKLARAIARHARHFGMRAVGVSTTGQLQPGFDECHPSGALDELLPCADFLVMALPETPATKNIVGRRQLDRLPRHAGLINIGRASALDVRALSDKLAADELAGAYLDVFEQDPLPTTSELWTTPRLVISPHCALDDGPNYIKLSLGIFLENLKRYMSGSTLQNVVDLKRGY